MINKAHSGPTEGHYQADTTTKKISQSSLWWTTLHKYYKIQVNNCDRCQILGQPLERNEMALISINPSLTFEMWEIDFVS